MGAIYVSSSTLDQKCKPYQETFSCEHDAESIKENAFPLQKRGPAEKCHDTSEWLQKGSQCSFIHTGELSEIAENRSSLTEKQVELYKTPKGIVELNAEGIELAVEKRIALFFQQAILCYRMSAFTFSARGADAQIGTSPGMKLAHSNTKFTIQKREAAHSSTIPTLIAHAKDGSTPDGFVYLKGGSSYYQHNATIGMHECVNGADELIDGKGTDGKLREKAVAILNEVAQGLDPVKATEKFYKSFDAEVTATRDKLAKDDTRGLVLERYHHTVQKIQRLAARDKAFYDGLVGVVIDPTNPLEKSLREVVYKKRYDVIRLQEVVESKIAKRIALVKKEMARDGSSLEYILLKACAETAERTIMEKLFGKTVAFFEKDYQPVPSTLKAFKTRITNVQAKYSQKITTLLRELRAEFRGLSSAEFTYRAGVFRDLRTKVQNWTQKQFQEHYEETTGYSVSQSWVSRMEQLSRVPFKLEYASPVNQRRRYVTIADGTRCAETFGVDPGIFLPCLFTSS